MFTDIHGVLVAVMTTVCMNWLTATSAQYYKQSGKCPGIS